MAKRKRTKKTSHRRRRVGAMSLAPSSALVKYGTIAAGFFLGGKINDQIDKITGGKIDGKIVGAAEAGLGALLRFGPGKKTTVTSIAGGLLLGAGLNKVLKEFNVIADIGGYGAVPVVGRRMNGYGSVPVVGGYMPSQMLAGSLNGTGSGYQVPRSPYKQVMGNTGDNGQGSMINNDSRN